MTPVNIWPRHQPPVHSPIPLRSLAAALVAAGRLGKDPRKVLASMVCRAFSARSAILCGSGTQALQLAILAARAQVGSDMVALPAFSCYDVASAAAGADARILLYDLDPDTLGPDLDSLRLAIREGAHTVVIAPLYGVPVDWDGVQAVAKREGAVLVEDAAQGHGAAWCRRELGTLGTLSVLSFGRGKGWTGGSGGALLLRDETGASEAADVIGIRGKRIDTGIAEEVRCLAATVAQAAVGRPAIFAVPSGVPWLALGETRYRPAGRPTSITRAGAALLLQSRAHATMEADTRRAHGAWYAEQLRGSHAALPISVSPRAQPGYLRFPVRLAAGPGTFADPGAARRLGIAPSYPSTLLALDPIRRRLAPSRAPCPGAEELVRTLFTLPTHSRVTTEERRRVVEMLGSQGSHASVPLEVRP
jgi:perosamine synthetase